MEFFREENFWFYLPLVIWLSGIFYLSSNKGSVSNTSRILSPLFKLFFPEKPLADLKDYHLYFRKFCHFAGYGMLALFAAMAFSNSTIPALAQYWPFFAFGLVLLTASTDEIKQSFYDTRIGSVADVVLDCAGGMTAILLFWAAVK